MRHFVALCPHFAEARASVGGPLGLQADWWAAQDRCLIKSGWVTLIAAPSVEQRAACQVAVCRLGVVVLGAYARGASQTDAPGPLPGLLPTTSGRRRRRHDDGAPADSSVRAVRARPRANDRPAGPAPPSSLQAGFRAGSPLRVRDFQATF